MRVETEQRARFLVYSSKGQEGKVAFDQILFAVGRCPRLDNLGLESLNLRRNGNGTIVVNKFLQTSVPSIYACGDVLGPFRFTHMASYQASYAVRNALFPLVKRAVDYSLVPWATFTDPEVATVGLNERTAQGKGLPYEITCLPVSEVDRAICEGETEGFIRVLTTPRKGRIIGATVVAAHGGELLMEYMLAIKQKMTLADILKTIHVYPTMMDANRHLAASWQEAHIPRIVSRIMRSVHYLGRA